MSPRTQTFCIDATNVIRGAYGYGGPQFRAQEDSDGAYFIDALSEFCLRLGSLVEVDMVFDGPHRSLPAGLPSNLRVRFAPERGADDLILDSIRARRHGGQKVTLVTSDAALAETAREEGARLLKPRSNDILGVIGSIEARLRP